MTAHDRHDLTWLPCPGDTYNDATLLLQEFAMPFTLHPDGGCFGMPRAERPRVLPPGGLIR